MHSGTPPSVGRGRDPAGEPVTDAVALANQLRPVLLHLNRHLRREVHALGVTAGQVWLLALIRDTPGIGIGELAAHEGTSAPSISTHVDRLEAGGLVDRERKTNADKRRVGLRVTAEGVRVLRAIRSRRTAWLAARLHALTEEDRRQIEAAVEALARLVERP